MNNILDYDGFRFFQSSFDQDELGTWLSVNHDWWGTWISYLGYAVLTIGMFLTFFSKSSRFQQLGRNIRKLRQDEKLKAALITGFIFFAQIGMASPTPVLGIKHINQAHAQLFGELVMQDHRGRMKPMNTYTSEILRKLSRKSSLYQLSSEQVLLGMAANPKDWYDVPLIKMGRHEKNKKDFTPTRKRKLVVL